MISDLDIKALSWLWGNMGGDKAIMRKGGLHLVGGTGGWDARSLHSDGAASYIDGWALEHNHVDRTARMATFKSSVWAGGILGQSMRSSLALDCQGCRAPIVEVRRV